MKRTLLVTVFSFLFLSFYAQDIQNNPGSNHGNKFEQLGTILPTPNAFRTASGAPGGQYWQQRCDYDIKCTLDEKNQKLSGVEALTYYNNSPDALTYLWLQLDENQHSSVNNSGYQTSSSMNSANVNIGTLDMMEENKTDNGLGDKIVKITDASGKAFKLYG